MDKKDDERSCVEGEEEVRRRGENRGMRVIWGGRGCRGWEDRMMG